LIPFYKKNSDVTISTKNALNNQIQSSMKMYMYIVWNCCLPIADFETTLLKPVFYLQKIMNFMKMRTFYKKKTTSFYKKLKFAYLVRTQTSNMSFIKKLHFWN